MGKKELKQPDINKIDMDQTQPDQINFNKTDLDGNSTQTNLI